MTKVCTIHIKLLNESIKDDSKHPKYLDKSGLSLDHYFLLRDFFLVKKAMSLVPTTPIVEQNATFVVENAKR